MRARISYYVARNRAGQLQAVPVHIVERTADPNDAWARAGWLTARALAGRRAGGTFNVHQNDIRHTPSGARLVPGSREAIAKYGPRELEEAIVARALRKRIGQRSLTDRQFQNAVDEITQLATRVRQKTPNDIAWRFFDRNLDAWNDRLPGGPGLRSHAPIVINMIDAVLAAASRYRPPSVDENSLVYARAAAAESHANALMRAIRAPLASEAPARWLEVADAFEVAEDAWLEAGDEDRADNVHAKRQNILTTIRLIYAPRRQRP